MLKTTNLEEVKHLIPNFLAEVGYINQTVNISDVDELLNDGWLVAPEINLSILNNHKGMATHMVIIHACTDKKYK